MKIAQVKSAQGAKTPHNNKITNESNRVEEESARKECKTQRQRDSARERDGERGLFEGEQSRTGANRGLLPAVRSTETRKSWTFAVLLSKAGAVYRSLRRF
jgi:hypothetical protein